MDHAKENKNFDYEFRTTVVADQLLKNDFEKMGEMIKGARKYYLQKFQPQEDLNNPDFSKRKAYSDKEMEELKEVMEKFVEKVFIR